MEPYQADPFFFPPLRRHGLLTRSQSTEPPSWLPSFFLRPPPPTKGGGGFFATWVIPTRYLPLDPDFLDEPGPLFLRCKAFLDLAFLHCILLTVRHSLRRLPIFWVREQFTDSCQSWLRHTLWNLLFFVRTFPDRGTLFSFVSVKEPSQLSLDLVISQDGTLLIPYFFRRQFNPPPPLSSLSPRDLPRRTRDGKPF